jgi:hypothetical protein
MVAANKLEGIYLHCEYKHSLLECELKSTHFDKKLS